MDLKQLRARPWRGYKPETDLSAPIGMVAPEERACYYWLARHWATGRGNIIDAGSFLGASTAAFAAGAADGGRRSFDEGPLLHAYDYFKVVDAYVGQAISRDFHRVEPGDSYLDIFQSQTAPYRDMIEPHAGDFLSHRWIGKPVEILFIDIAKTSDLNAHAVAEFFPALIPGHSIVVQQDYFHCWHPYIHIAMEFFDKEFELLDENVPYQSRVWRLKSPLPAAKIARVANQSIPLAEGLHLLDRLIAKSSDTARPMIELVRIWEQLRLGAVDGAAAGMAAFRAKYDLETHHELWAKQGLEVAQNLKETLSRA